MPHFFIDSDDGHFYNRDDDGFDFPDREAARQAALEALPDMLKDTPQGGDYQNLKVLVRDKKGSVLYSATMTLVGEWKCLPTRKKASTHVSQTTPARRRRTKAESALAPLETVP